MELHPSPDHDSAATLDRAQQLAREARRSARWYVRYLIAFAAASLVMSTLYGVLGGVWGVAILTPLWVVFLTVLTVYSTRQRTVVRGMTRVHTTMIVAWAIGWGITVIVGSTVFPDRVWWWVLGGLITATPPLLAARRIHERTRS